MKIQVTFYPNVEKSELENGYTVAIGWQRLHETLEMAFDIKENEMLIGVTITEGGIKAKIIKN